MYSGKRCFDIAVSLTLLPFAIVICAAVAIIYFFVERESPFFCQKRIGLNESEFNIFKMRTMRIQTQDMGTHEISESAITNVGRFLRRTKIDELPQLWNVLIGEMSLVGPRPGLFSQNELKHERRALKIFTMRPGMTGLSQVRGLDMSDPVKLAKSDYEYRSSASLLGDLRILIRTVLISRTPAQ